ncbi:hypothetical protein LXL04_014206 [Taraxacum kok-saghyz]
MGEVESCGEAEVSGGSRYHWWLREESDILDVAKGLCYLHEGIKPPIFHRDIKATNILLDLNMKALAPEYALYGQLTERSDAYSFGIIVLEIMSGRKVLEEVKGTNSGMVLIADWAWEMVKSDQSDEVFNDSIREELDCFVLLRWSRSDLRFQKL